jgi:hypothetical protein
MKVRKLAPLGVSALAAASTLLPLSAHAASPSTMKPQMVGGNAAVDVQTDVDCTQHAITVSVKNKLSGDITPHFTYANQPVDVYDLPIKPGKSAKYSVPFDGNNTMNTLKVQVDGQQDVAIDQDVNCNEPVTFTVDKAADGAVSGWIRNNNDFVGATALARVNGSDTQVINLNASESKYVALPFTPTNSGVQSIGGVPQRAFVTIGTTNGYQGTYSVDLNSQQVPLPPVTPLPDKKN